MAVTKEQLKNLTEPIDYKYRLQSAKSGRATIVSYIDSRQVAQRLDDVLGAQNWQDDYKLIDGKLFGGIGVLVIGDNGGEYWNWKWDVGTESNVDAEKGEISDAFKRAAVKLGLGRFLYSLGIITLKTVTHTNGKEYPATDEGNILWNVDELTDYCKRVVSSGELDRTKRGVKPLQGAKTVTPKPVDKIAPTATKKEEPKTGAIQPSKEFDDSTEARQKTVEWYKGIKVKSADILKEIIKAGYKPDMKIIAKPEEVLKVFLAEAPLDTIKKVNTSVSELNSKV